MKAVSAAAAIVAAVLSIGACSDGGSAAEGRIESGPVLTDPRPGCVSVRWESAEAGMGVLCYGPAGRSPDRCVPSPSQTKRHAVTLSDLTPSSRYACKVGENVRFEFTAPGGGGSASAIAILRAGAAEPCWDAKALTRAWEAGARGALLLCSTKPDESARQADRWGRTAWGRQLPAVLWPKAAADFWDASGEGRFGAIGIARGNPPETPEDEEVDRPGGAGLVLVPAVPTDDGPHMGEIRMIWTPLLVSPGERTEMVRGAGIQRLTVAPGDVVLAEVTAAEISINHIKPEGAPRVLLTIGRE